MIAPNLAGTYIWCPVSLCNVFLPPCLLYPRIVLPPALYSHTFSILSSFWKHYLLPSLLYTLYILFIYRVIHKSLRDFRPLRYSSQDGHTEGEHVNRGRGTPSFCPTLQVLDMCTLGDFWGLLTNVSRTRSTVSADGPGRPLRFAAHRQPLCWNFMYHSRIVLSVGGSVRYMVRNLRCTVTIDSVLANSKTQNAFLFTVHAIFRHDYPLALEPASTPRPLVQKKTLRDSLPIDMLLSAVSVLVVAQSSSEFPEGLTNNPVYGTLLGTHEEMWQ